MTKTSVRQHDKKDVATKSFSEWMRETISDQIRTAGLTISEWRKGGEKDHYSRARLSGTDTPVEIFVYDDEVGFFFGHEWIIAENPDYSSRQDMAQWLMKQLLARIGKAHGRNGHTS